MPNTSSSDPNWIQLSIFDLQHFHKDKIPKKKKCRRCNKNQILAEFSNDKNNRDGKVGYCKTCERKRGLQLTERRKAGEDTSRVKLHPPLDGTKFCRACKQWKCSSEFHKQTCGKELINRLCKECTKTNTKTYYETKKSKKSSTLILFYYKRCSNCKIYKEVTKFTPSVTSTDGLQAWCHDCKQPKTNEYLRQNKPRMNAHRAKRRHRKAQATPNWANLDQVTEIYKEATNLKKETGIAYEVDHLIPLKHELIVGLHVPSNLQILTRTENVRKHNKFTPFVWSELTPEEQQDPLYNPFWREQGNL